MKATLGFGTAMLLALLLFFFVRVDGFKNVSFQAENQIKKITNKVLPSNALCIKGSQCLSGVCLESNNEALYGYCR
jgi:hypothetical protein